MAISFEDYINTILPSFLSNDAGRAYFKAFAEVANQEFDREKFAREEGMIYECTDDALVLHMANSSALVSPFETLTQMRQYLKNRWEGLAKRIGSVELLLDELKRFGFPSAKVWTWTDLIQAGVPRAFGGNWTLFPGLTPNGGMRYLAKYPNIQVTVEHLNSGPNQPLSVSIGATVSTANITIQLQTDGAGFPLSRPIDILKALDDAKAGEYMYYNWQGTGLGSATAALPTILPTVYHSFFIIDLFAPNAISDPILWNDNTITTYPYTVGPQFTAWKPSEITLPEPTPFITAMWGTNKSNIWMRIEGTKDFYRYNGSSWSTVPSDLRINDYVNDIFGTSDSNIMACITSNTMPAIPDPGIGTVYRWNNAIWEKQTFSLSNPVNVWYPRKLWGASGVAMWVVGFEEDPMATHTGKIYFYDGLTWVNQAIPMGIQELLLVFGFAFNDVWAIGATSVIHYDGSTWSTVTGPTLGMGETMTCIWGTSSSNIYVGTALGSTGGLFRWNGTTWSSITVPSGMTPINIIGFSDTDIYVLGQSSVGNTNVIFRYNGVTGTSYDAPTNLYPNQYPNNNWMPFVASSGEILAGIRNISKPNRSYLLSVRNWTDGTLAALPSYSEAGISKVFRDIHGISDTYAWAVGDVGEVYFYNGTSWVKKLLPDLTAQMLAVFVLDPSNVWFVGIGGKSFKWNGTSFTAYSLGVAIPYRDVWFAEPNEGYAVGDNSQLTRFNGVSWTSSTVTFPAAPTSATLTAIDGISRFSEGKKASIAFVGQDPALLLGTSNLAFFNEETGAKTYRALSSLAYTTDVKLIDYNLPEYAVVVGNNAMSQGTVVNVAPGYFNSSVTASTEFFGKMMYFAPNDYWIAGLLTNKVFRYDGNSYTAINLPDTGGVFSLWGNVYNNLWIAYANNTTNTSQVYKFSPTTTNLAAGASGKLWNDGWNWDGTLLTDKNLMNELRFLIRKYKPSTTSCRFVRIGNKGMLTSSPIGEEYEEDPFGNISGPYLFSYLVP